MRRSRSVPALVAVGTRYIAAVLSGRAASTGRSSGSLSLALVRALRLHFFAFPAAAALAGSAALRDDAANWRVPLAAASVGLAWGVGQLLNDVLDLEADAVDAPDRPLVSGALPEGPAAAIALLLGAVVTVALALVHTYGIALVGVSALLLFSYGRAKAIAGLGNLFHGALMAVMACIGALATLPAAPIREVLSRVGPSALLVGAIAALYLQANYEKDRRGDARAGYRTLAHVLGIRLSAGLRALACGAVALTALELGLLPDVASRGFMLLALIGWGISSLAGLFSGHERGALSGYRWAVHATTAALVSLAEPRLGLYGAAAFLLVAALLVERAFRVTTNP
jgi:geranylgeranylglycerol-phosphate geranylgeranyltransferase